MYVRIACLSLAGVLCAMSALADDDAAKLRAAEEKSIRAQIEHMDIQIQSIQTQILQLDQQNPGDAAKRSELHDKVRSLDFEEDRLLGRLRKLMALDPPETHRSTPPIEEKPAPTPSSPAATVPPPPAAPPPPASPPPAASPPDHGPALRSAADPVQYEKAAGDPQGAFRYYAYKWAPVGTRQMVVYTTYDQAYLLDFSGDCPGLLSTSRIEVENNSTKVVAGKHGVIADGMRCPITMIRELHLSRIHN